MPNLEDRMKEYERVHNFKVSPRTPVILRIDGKAFHSLTKDCYRPYDITLASALDRTATALLEEIQNSRMAYIQSDEISILLVDYNKFNSQQWFMGKIQKMVSVSASVASANFSRFYNKIAYFDSRVISLPESEVTNYFIWRQQDATRNSIQMMAQSLYSHKELHGMSCGELQEMIHSAGINWNDIVPYWKRGRVIKPSGIDRNIPIFSKDREYIEKFLEVEES